MPFSSPSTASGPAVPVLRWATCVAAALLPACEGEAPAPAAPPDAGPSDADAGAEPECVVGRDCQSGRCSRGWCLPPSCDDGLENGDETGQDCGGACAACGEGAGCLSADDCASGVCSAGICVHPGCSDGVVNGGESGVDCGGPCPRCEPGQTCRTGEDCDGGVCTDLVCQAPSCDDELRNQDETDTDCGGGCTPCEDGQGCVVAGDCAGGSCDLGLCKSDTCGDERRNGRETDVDCGGDCPPCAERGLCELPEDCETGFCDRGVCKRPPCEDIVENGTETDVDCGGDQCPPCPDGLGCGRPSDCESRVCRYLECQVPTCEDGVANGAESDVDCAGECAPCGSGQGCRGAVDCESEVCLEGVCGYRRSCREILEAGGAEGSGAYAIDTDADGEAEPFEVWCEMEADGGGWTLALKVDGARRTFVYDSQLWTNAETHQPEEASPDRTETKSRAFSEVPFSALRLGMQVGDEEARWIVVEHEAPSLLARLEDGSHTPTAAGREAWRSLLSATSLQPHCDQEGFNVGLTGVFARARIGIVGNEQRHCASPDSRIGFGGGGDCCGQDPNNACGNEAGCGGDRGDFHRRAFGWVYVR